MNLKHLLKGSVLVALLLILITGLTLAKAQESTPLGTGFTYQGQLKYSGVPYTGLCDFQFGLWDSVSGGTQVSYNLTLTDIDVEDGSFSVQLDWDLAAFQGDARWINIFVRCPAGTGEYTQLTPRQPVTATPYALYALSADPAVVQQRVTGSCEEGFAIRVVNQNGSVSCEPSGGSAWQLTGNAGTIPGTNYLGTSDNVALELKVNGLRALRLEPNSASPNLVGGYLGNWLTSGVYAATIGGGGDSTHVNGVTDSYGTVGGGAGNRAGDNAGTITDAMYATVSGGSFNTASGYEATVSGGHSNTASHWDTTVGGGWDNTASGDYATVGGGDSNTASAIAATVGGGWDNLANGNAATVAGGFDNTATDDGAFVGGGRDNNASGHLATLGGGGTNTASGHYATLGGGDSNTASGYGTTVSGGLDNIANGDEATIGGGYENLASGIEATISGGWDNTASLDYATVGGGSGNQAINIHTTVCGGSDNVASNDHATVGGGDSNNASGSDSTVGGGSFNTATYYAATVAGGSNNDATGDYDTIAGGYWNQASNIHATVGGGYSNTANGSDSTVGGGYSNEATSGATTVGGGFNNTANNNGATIPGGADNIASGGYSFAAGGHAIASGTNATVGGGNHNTASGNYATVPGGNYNLAQGNYSFAAGNRAQALNQGCFVWGDSTNADVWCTVNNSWVVRTSGGVTFYTDPSFGTGSYIAAGGSSWNSVSDRATKENFSPVDGQTILDILASLPVQEYNLKSQDESIRHVGPVAQDFAVFGYGESDKAINMEDADGVALAAIQELYQQLQQKDAKIEDLETRLTALEQAVQTDKPAHSGVSISLPWLLVVGLFFSGGTWVARHQPGYFFQ